MKKTLALILAVAIFACVFGLNSSFATSSDDYYNINFQKEY